MPPGRNIENISVPMSGNEFRRNSTPKRVILRNGIQGYLEEADLTLTRLNFGAQSRSHKLSAQTQSDSRLAMRCRIAHQGALVGEVGILVLFVGTLRTATQRQTGEAFKGVRGTI